MKIRSTAVIPLLTLGVAFGLSGCDSTGDKIAGQYEMLKRSKAPRSELCTFAQNAAQEYLQENNNAKFQKWEATRKEVCDVAGPLSGPAQGQISGALSYPSDYLPEDMIVCARNIDSRDDTCKPTGGNETYSLDLAPGRYIVWSSTNDTDGRAFYTKAVVCGLSVECSDHSPIEIKIRAGEKRTAIDPGDYYSAL